MAASFLDKIGNLFGGGDTLPWTDSEMIAVSCDTLFIARELVLFP
jgi:hypothetical protein